MEFGELTRVAVSEVWPHEAHHFTPWLADNLDRLAKAIGIPLELEDTEVAVEGYSADITATNRDNGHRVLIENQYGRTDHQHLGQILTYLAGLEAQTVVWISEEFTEPHLSAIRWLNEHTAEPFSFLAVRLSLVRITDSPIAPRFEVVEHPNSWDRMVRASPHTGELSETGAFRREFWTYHSERYPEDVPQAYATSNVWVYVPEADFNISLMLARRRVGLFLRGSQGERAESVYERALPYEAGFRSHFDWPEDEPIWNCFETLNIDTHDRSNWPQMVDWLHQRLEIYLGILKQDAPAS